MRSKPLPVPPMNERVTSVSGIRMAAPTAGPHSVPMPPSTAGSAISSENWKLITLSGSMYDTNCA